MRHQPDHMESFQPAMILAQVLQIGQAVDDRDASRVAVVEIGRVFGRYVARKSFLSL